MLVYEDTPKEQWPMWNGKEKRPPPKLPPTFESSYPSLAQAVKDMLPNLTGGSSEEAQGTEPEPGLQVFLSHAAE